MANVEKNDETKRKRSREGGDSKSEILVSSKVRRTIKRFTEDELVGIDGIRRIYEEFPLATTSRGRGCEATLFNDLFILFYAVILGS